jgi:quinolinate synthase
MSELVEKLARLKTERNAVVLAHNYQRPEVQDSADFVGDSLGLSQRAAETDADVILFCGVHFMAETAAILCPEKTVLIPDENAGCPMANMVSVRELKDAKAKHPNAVVVCYVNSSAAVKAQSDICCTSANGVQVVKSVPRDREVLFIPDASLGSYVSKELGRPLILWAGFCPTHHRILAEEIARVRQAHPAAKVVVHPECTEDVIDLADHVASTTGILKYCHEANAQEFIVGTEIGIGHRLKKENPDKEFHMLTVLADCPNMKLNTIEKMVWALEDMQPQVTVAEDIAARARGAIERMLAIPRA